MKNVNKFTVVAILFALFLTNSVLGDNIPTEGKWRDEYYRSADAPLPPVASIEGDILSLDFEDALSNLTVCVMNDRGVKICKHSKKCTFYTLRFGCSFAAVNTIKPQLL